MSDSDRKRWALVTTTGVLTGVGHGFAAFAVSALLKPLALDLETGRGAVSIAIGLEARQRTFLPCRGAHH